MHASASPARRGAVPEAIELRRALGAERQRSFLQGKPWVTQHTLV
jgi:hypothetical protein